MEEDHPVPAGDPNTPGPELPTSPLPETSPPLTSFNSSSTQSNPVTQYRSTEDAVQAQVVEAKPRKKRRRGSSSSPSPSTRRHRRQFSEQERKETAWARVVGVCGRCKKNKTRCDPQRHKDLLLPRDAPPTPQSSVPSFNNGHGFSPPAQQAGAAQQDIPQFINNTYQVPFQNVAPQYPSEGEYLQPTGGPSYHDSYTSNVFQQDPNQIRRAGPQSSSHNPSMMYPPPPRSVPGNMHFYGHGLAFQDDPSTHPVAQEGYSRPVDQQSDQLGNVLHQSSHSVGWPNLQSPSRHQAAQLYTNSLANQSVTSHTSMFNAGNPPPTSNSSAAYVMGTSFENFDMSFDQPVINATSYNQTFPSDDAPIRGSPQMDLNAVQLGIDNFHPIQQGLMAPGSYDWTGRGNGEFIAVERLVRSSSQQVLSQGNAQYGLPSGFSDGLTSTMNDDPASLNPLGLVSDFRVPPRRNRLEVAGPAQQSLPVEHNYGTAEIASTSRVNNTTDSSTLGTPRAGYTIQLPIRSGSGDQLPSPALATVQGGELHTGAAADEVVEGDFSDYLGGPVDFTKDWERDLEAFDFGYPS